VVRNTVRRRLRAICFHTLDRVAAGTDVVIRALPGSDQLSFDKLSSEIQDGLERSAA
jgi:ribonuclease P protein component